MDAIAEAIRARVESKGWHVFMHRRLSLDATQDQLPAITVDFGEDQPADSQLLDSLGSALSVMTTCRAVEAEESALRSLLLDMRVECHRGVMADRRQGLSFVVSTFYGGASAPEIDPEGEAFSGGLTSTWLVQYRMSLTDPTSD